MNNSRRMAGKVLQWDYDAILLKSDQKCCFSLTRRDVALIMAITEQMHWQTRYLSPTGANIDMDLVDAWASGLETRLMDGCCPDGTLSRFTDDGTYQTSVDGGLTWQDTPREDPRNSAIGAPPLPGSGDTTRCAAADNVRDQFKNMRDNLVALLTAGTTIIAIIAGLAALLGIILGMSGVATYFGVLLIGLAAELLSLTPTSVMDQLTDAVMDTFRCLVYCRMEPSGQITYDQWHELLSDIDATFTGFPHTFFFSIVNSMGYIGISNAGTMGLATADDCDCDCELDCGDGWEVLEGTYLGQFGLYHRYQSADTSGTQTIYIRKSDNPDNCCKLLDARFVSGEEFFAAAYHKICGGGGLDSGWGLEGCYWTLAGQTLTGHAENTFVVEFYWGDCA